MLHNIITNNGILANIYVREKNKQGENLELDTIIKTGDTSQDKNNNNDPNNNNHQNNKMSSIDFKHSLEEAINKFKFSDLSDYKNGYYETFDYIVRSDWSITYAHIKKYIDIRDSGNIINKDLLTKEYKKDNIFWTLPDIFTNKVYKFIYEYYEKFSLHKRNEYDVAPYYFAHNEVISRILQYELLPLLEKITGENLKPTRTKVIKYDSNNKIEPHNSRYKYIVRYIIDGDWPLLINNKSIDIPTYVGDYYVLNDDYTTISAINNGIILYKSRNHIVKQEILNGKYYGIDLFYN